MTSRGSPLTALATFIFPNKRPDDICPTSSQLLPFLGYTGTGGWAGMGDIAPRRVIVLIRCAAGHKFNKRRPDVVVRREESLSAFGICRAPFVAGFAKLCPSKASRAKTVNSEAFLQKKKKQRCATRFLAHFDDSSSSSRKFAAIRMARLQLLRMVKWMRGCWEKFIHHFATIRLRYLPLKIRGYRSCRPPAASSLPTPPVLIGSNNGIKPLRAPLPSASAREFCWILDDLSEPGTASGRPPQQKDANNWKSQKNRVYKPKSINGHLAHQSSLRDCLQDFSRLILPHFPPRPPERIDQGMR
ncbi:unnamed protein product [Caenorhabditis auriculariae]|uniref:Uncharacterized protein n=1 Tax=Caenorhabditis auriculariae TaxID=2777116 RepID=A0A8S1HGQ3_9PELO|nr:unnamed protein product [Caenorhabditis auriculariae]